MRRPPAASPRAIAPCAPPRHLRRMRAWPIPLILTLACLALVAPGRADAAPLTLYTNTAGPVSIDDPPVPIDATTLLANQFFTFGSQSVIGSLELSLVNVADLADIQVELYDNTFNATTQTDEPGTRIGTFRPGSHTDDLYQFFLTSQPWLDADASYWIVATAKSPSASAVWTWTTLTPTGDDPLHPGQPLDQSVLWGINGGSGLTVSSGGPYQMQIVVTTVPEPSTWAMGAAALACACARALRRRSGRSPQGFVVGPPSRLPPGADDLGTGSAADASAAARG